MAQNEPKNKLIEHPVLILTCSAKAAADTSRFLAVTSTGVTPSAGAKPFGFTNTEVSEGEDIPAIVVGVTIARAGAAITADQEVELDASGRVIPLSAGKAVGMALVATAQAGDLTSVRLY